MTVNQHSVLRPTKAPNLPMAEAVYHRPSQEALNSALRLYFNQIDNATSALFGPFGGKFVDCSYGLFFDLTTQTPATINTAYNVAFGQTYLSNGVRLTNGSEITIDIAGVYNFQFSGQLTSTNSSAKTVYVWISRNGVDIGYSTHAYTITGSGTQMEISWNFNIDMQAGDHIRIKWAATDTAISLTTVAPTTPHPGIPSAVMAVSFIAPLPAALPTPP